LIEIAGVSILVALFIPTLLDGVERKIRARIHSRIGPPILQTWYDVLKLFGKDFFVPANAVHTVMLLFMSLAIQILLIGYTCIAVVAPITPYDLVVIAVLAIISQAAFISIPLTIANPFSIIGASREIVLMLVNEGAFLALVGLYAYYTGITAFSSIGGASPTLYTLLTIFALYIFSYVASSRIPFDIAEAEPEIASGLLIELSGPLLGVFLYTLHLKRFFFKLFASLLLLALFIKTGALLLASSIVLTIVLWLVYAVIANILGRSRVDLASITLLKAYLVIIALSVLGYFLEV